MGVIKYVLWNSNGLRASADTRPRKMNYFDKTFPKAIFDVAAFVETHHKDEDDFPELILGYKVTHNIVHAPTQETHTHSGVIILIRKTIDILNSEILIPGRLLNLQIKHKTDNQIYNLSVYYGIRLEKSTKADMENISQTFIKAHQSTDNNILLGDFNFIENDMDKEKGMDWRDKPMTTEWTKLKLHAQIIDPMRIQFPKKKVYSFVGKMGKSRVDRVYVNEETIHLIADHTYTITLFNLAHKIPHFKINGLQAKAQSYWKSSTILLWKKSREPHIAAHTSVNRPR